MKKLLIMFACMLTAGLMAIVTREQTENGTVINYLYGQHEVFDRAPGEVRFAVEAGSPYCVACAAMAPAAVAVLRDTLLLNGDFSVNTLSNASFEMFFESVLTAGAQAYRSIPHDKSGFAAPESVARYFETEYPIRFDQSFNTSVDTAVFESLIGSYTTEAHIRLAARSLAERVFSAHLPAAGVVFTGAGACRTLFFIAPHGKYPGAFALYDSHADAGGNLGSYLWIGKGIRDARDVQIGIDQMIEAARQNGRWWIGVKFKNPLSTVFIDVLPEGVHAPAAGPADAPRHQPVEELNWHVVDFAGNPIDLGRWQTPMPQLWGVPSLGTYSEDYNFRSKMFVIRHTDALLAAAPDAVRRAVAGMHPDTYVIVWGDHVRSDELKDNVVLHPVVRRWTNPAGESDMTDFNVNVQAGVFDAVGVLSGGGAPVPFGDLAPVNVNFHDQRFSPDNARIRYTPSAQCATFWLVARFGGQALVTYNVVLLDKDLLDNFVAVFSTKNKRIDDLQAWARSNRLDELARMSAAQSLPMPSAPRRVPVAGPAEAPRPEARQTAPPPPASVVLLPEIQRRIRDLESELMAFGSARFSKKGAERVQKRVAEIKDEICKLKQ